MATKFILIALFLSIFMKSDVNCMSYTVSSPNDNLSRILKEKCGSARLLIENAAANNIKSPYTVVKGSVLEIECSNAPKTTIKTTIKPITTKITTATTTMKTTRPTTTKTTTETTTTTKTTTKTTTTAKPPGN